MTSKSIPPSNGVMPTPIREDRPVARVEERSSTDSLDRGSLDVPATPAVLVTPPTPGPYESSAGSQSGWSPLSPLTDLCDISETSTVCDDAEHTSTTKVEENTAEASTAEARPQPCDHPPPTFTTHLMKPRRETIASGYSEAVSYISPSYVTENGAGEKDGNLDHEAAKAWSNGARAMMELDDANVQRWKEEIDTLLVFAGLFSAVVTGFLTETMRLLRPEPSAATVAILERISAQLRNPEGVLPDIPAERFVPNHHIVQVNSLWFTSLILSLGVAFVGILVKQWLGEYPAGLMTVSRSRISKKHMRARQYRHTAFERWFVRAIMTALPFFLLSALILFCGGLSLLLVTMDLKVAIVAICMIGFIFAFSLATTILPSVWSACSYRSPQAFLVFVLVQAVLYLGRTCARWAYALVSPSPNTSTEHTELKLCPTRSVSGLGGGPSKRCLSTRFCDWAKRSGGQRTYWSWQEREEATLLSSRAPYRMALLDELDSVKMDVVVLQDVVRPCILTLPLDEAIPCFRNILNRRAEVVVHGLPKWESDIDRETCRVLVDMLLDMLARPELSLGSASGTAAMTNVLRKHEKVLGMLNRLIGTGHHRSFLCGSYERIFSILLQYIREPQCQYISREGTILSLVITTLATLQDKIPPDMATKEDVRAVSEYHACILDNAVSLRVRVAALASAMILALPSTGDMNSEDCLEDVRSMIRITGKDFRTATLHGQVSDDELMHLLHSFHVWLSTLEDLLRINPKFLTHDMRKGLELTAFNLAARYKAVHQCAYIDSNGRSTEAYLTSVTKLMKGLEVSPPAVRLQTPSPEVLFPETVQEPEPARSSKPPSRATVHWPSWPNLRSFYSHVESGEELPLESLQV